MSIIWVNYKHSITEATSVPSGEVKWGILLCFAPLVINQVDYNIYTITHDIP